MKLKTLERRPGTGGRGEDRTVGLYLRGVQLRPLDGTKENQAHSTEKHELNEVREHVCGDRPCPCRGGACEELEARTVPHGDLSLPQGLGSPRQCQTYRREPSEGPAGAHFRVQDARPASTPL